MCVCSRHVKWVSALPEFLTPATDVLDFHRSHDIVFLGSDATHDLIGATTL